MSYKNLILFSLLMPRLEIFAIGGVNSDMRLDVILLMFVSLIPVFKKFSIWALSFVILLFSLSIIQGLLFEPQLNRMIFGLLLYISIIFFSQYSKILSLDDLTYICRWFLLINGGLHLIDMITLSGVNHNFTGRYGVFNQHFAFATSLVISYFFLFFYDRRDKLTDFIFWTAFLLSGSRGLIIGVFISILIINANFIKHYKFYFIGLFAVPVIGFGAVYLAPENIYIQRGLLIFELITMASGDIASILTDPAFNVRVSNIYNYIEYVSGIGNSWIYFLTGGGPYSFLDYSIQFGRPGHFDNLYFRILSEFGFIALALMLIVIFYNKGVDIRLNGLIIALLIAAIVSEAIVTLKVGHLFFLTLLFFKNHNEVTSKNTQSNSN